MTAPDHLAQRRLKSQVNTKDIRQWYKTGTYVSVVELSAPIIVRLIKTFMKYDSSQLGNVFVNEGRLEKAKKHRRLHLWSNELVGRLFIDSASVGWLRLLCRSKNFKVNDKVVYRVAGHNKQLKKTILRSLAVINWSGIKGEFYTKLITHTNVYWMWISKVQLLRRSFFYKCAHYLNK